MQAKILFSTLLFCLLLPLSAQETPKERPYRMGHTHGYFPYSESDCYGSQAFCSDAALVRFLDTAYLLPKGMEPGPEIEKTTVTFIVEKDGSISEPQVYEAENEALKTAAIAAILSMNDAGVRWVPGNYKDKVVRSQQSLDIPLKGMKVLKKEESQDPSERIYKVVEQMPKFPHDIEDCESIPGGHRIDCAHFQLKAFIQKTMNYPAEAEVNYAEGMAVVSMIIEKDGSISSPTLARDPGYGMGTEALRIVAEMMAQNKIWTPGMHEGKIVRVQFNLPVKFKLPR